MKLGRKEGRKEGLKEYEAASKYKEVKRRKKAERWMDGLMQLMDCNRRNAVKWRKKLCLEEG